MIVSLHKNLSLLSVTLTRNTNRPLKTTYLSSKKNHICLASCTSQTVRKLFGLDH